MFLSNILILLESWLKIDPFFPSPGAEITADLLPFGRFGVAPVPLLAPSPESSGGTTSGLVLFASISPPPLVTGTSAPEAVGIA